MFIPIYLFICLFIYLLSFFLSRFWIIRTGSATLTLGLLMSYTYMEHAFLMFLDHTQRRTTVGTTPLDEWSARRRDLYLITHDTHNRQISMPPVGFEPKISAGRSPAEILGSNPTGAWIFVCCECRCCQVEVSATSWSLVQRSPTDCAASLCMI